MDSYATNPSVLRNVAKRQEKEQLEADSFGLSLLVRAGYEPTAFADFFDRITETRGKKGNWFTDLFGLTLPDSKRLREIVRNTAPAPAGCADTAGRMTSEEFSSWRQAVIAYSGFGKQESLPASAHKEVMQDPLRSELRYLRFSPDGKYVLAQDDASIYVLSREPFVNLFRIDAEDAFDAQFTPDSKSIVFQTSEFRIENWDIQQQQLSDTHELYIARPCMQSVLSPTGEYLACLQLGENNDFPAQLAILDVKTGEQVWVKKDVFDPSFYQLLAMAYGYRPRINLEFSPDGTYFAGSNSTAGFAFDLKRKEPVQLGKVKDYMYYDFAFLTDDTILGIKGDRGEKSAIVKFPSGEPIKQIATGLTSLERAAGSNYVILRPVIHAAAGVLGLDKEKFYVASRTRAVDIYNGILLGELRNGGLGLFKSASEPPVATVQLPKGPMVDFTAISASPDLKYLTYSGWMRGAIWDTATGSRLLHVRGFRGAYFDDKDDLLALFPAPDSYTSKGYQTKEEWKEMQSKQSQNKEEGKVGAEAARWVPGSTNFFAMNSLPRRFDTWQHGPYMLVSERLSADGMKISQRELEVHDMASGQKLWSRKFADGELTPGFYTRAGDSLTFLWDIKEHAAKTLLKDDPELKAKIDALPDKNSALLIEVLDHRTGTRRFVIPFDTGKGSVWIREIQAVGDIVMLRDTQNRLMILNSRGERIARLFATRGVLDRTGNLLAAQTEPGRITVFSTSGMQKKDIYTFNNKVAYLGFSGDSKRLVVITADQTFYTFEM